MIEYVSIARHTSQAISTCFIVSITSIVYNLTPSIFIQFSFKILPSLLLHRRKMSFYESEVFDTRPGKKARLDDTFIEDPRVLDQSKQDLLREIYRMRKALRSLGVNPVLFDAR